MMRSVRAAAGVAAIITFAVSSARAQGTGDIRGRVADEAGVPVVDVQIELAPGARRALSEDDGTFVFAQVKPGSYTLQIRRIGYQPQTVKIDVGARATASPAITLVAIPRVLDSIRVSERANALRYTGTVLDERSAPIEGAIVMVAGKARELRTDADGRFSVDGFSVGSVVVRVRKLGFAPQLHALQMVNSKIDTVRMKRLVQSLSPVEVMAQSGFGKDTFAYRDLDQRMRWKSEKAYVISREEFAEQGTTDLATAIRFSGTGGRFGGTLSHPMPNGCIIINGVRALRDWPLTAFYADEVEAVEVYPPKTDPSGSLEVRGCDPDKQVYVIWMKANSKRFPPGQ
jgi:hypothetical protein